MMRMSMISKAAAKNLLKKTGKWVLDHHPDNYGNFKHPTQKPETSEIFQKKVEEYAKNLALATNLIARDAPHDPEEKGCYGQHWRSGRNREMILPEDVEIAAQLIQDNILHPEFILGKWMEGEKAEIVGPKRCITCDNEYDYLVTCSLGFACPHCYHLVRSMTFRCNEGDSLPEDEVKKLSGESDESIWTMQQEDFTLHGEEE